MQKRQMIREVIKLHVKYGLVVLNYYLTKLFLGFKETVYSRLKVVLILKIKPVPTFLFSNYIWGRKTKWFKLILRIIYYSTRTAQNLFFGSMNEQQVKMFININYVCLIMMNVS